MFEWLKQWLPRKAPPTIRTFDDLTAALKSRVIKPHLRKDGEVQTLDPFAETGLSLRERKKVMLRSFGSPAGIRMYVHRDCAAPCLVALPKDNAVSEPHTEEWLPADLIGRFRDVTHGDHCGREFQPMDDGYLAYWIVTTDELELLAQVQREQAED